jgi:hypothetical protein
VSERDPAHLLDEHCCAAREIIGAKWAVVGLVNEEEAMPQPLFTSGLDRQTAGSLVAMRGDDGVFGTILSEHRARRLRHESDEAKIVGLPAQFPPAQSFLGAPITYQARVYG